MSRLSKAPARTTVRCEGEKLVMRRAIGLKHVQVLPPAASVKCDISPPPRLLTPVRARKTFLLPRSRARDASRGRVALIPNTILTRERTAPIRSVYLQMKAIILRRLVRKRFSLPEGLFLHSSRRAPRVVTSVLPLPRPLRPIRHRRVLSTGLSSEP